MFQSDDDLVYCCDLDCKEANKIINSFKQQSTEHNGHKTKFISELRSELLQIGNEEKSVQKQLTHGKEYLMNYIDKEIDGLTKLFHQTMLDFGRKLKQFVNDNLVSMKNIQLLFKAVLDNDRELINQYQSELGCLKGDSKYIKEQDLYSKDLNQQLQKTFELTKIILLDLSQIALQKPSIPEKVIHKWSSVNKHQSTTIEGQIVKNVSPGYNSALIEPKLTFQEIRTVQLKSISSISSFIQICDLKFVKAKCPLFQDIDQDGFGAYSQINDGRIFATDTYGQKKQKTFTFKSGDLLELQWNGPFKTFTTLKVSTGEKFEFKVSYSADAEIYFGVEMYMTDSFQIV